MPNDPRLVHEKDCLGEMQPEMVLRRQELCKRSKQKFHSGKLYMYQECRKFGGMRGKKQQDKCENGQIVTQTARDVKKRGNQPADNRKALKTLSQNYTRSCSLVFKSLLHIKIWLLIHERPCRLHPIPRKLKDSLIPVQEFICPGNACYSLPRGPEKFWK